MSRSQPSAHAAPPRSARRPRAQDPRRFGVALESAYLISFEWDIERDEVRRFHSSAPVLDANADRPNRFETIVQAVHPDDRTVFRAAVQAAIDDPEGHYESEFRLATPPGQRQVWLYERGRIQRGRDGRPRRLIGVSQDITARKEAEQRLRASEERLREADRQKDEFLAMLAHELRNTLAPIRTTVGITSADAVVSRVRDVVDRQVTQMARLLDDLLDVSRLARESLLLQRRPTALAEVLDAALETSRPLLAHNALRLVVDQPAEPVILDADAVRLTQVFANLLNNAAKYSHPGDAVTLTVRLEEAFVAVSVSDTGIGIAPHMLPRVFDLFAQGTEARSHAPGGLGIGLSLAQRLVDMHGGRIDVCSPGTGEGSTFTVRLPLLVTADAPAGDDTVSPLSAMEQGDRT